MYNQEIYDRIVQHLADTRLYEAETQANVGSAIGRHQLRLRDLLVKNIKAELSPEITRTMKELNSITTTATSEYANAAVSFHVNNLNKSVSKIFSVKAPSGSAVAREIIGPNVGSDNRGFTDHFNSIGSLELTRIQVRIGRGLADGEPHATIIKDVLDSTKMTESQVKSLVRTSITRTQSVAITQVMDNNADLLKGYRFTAVLDARTSPTCSYHDGKVYPMTDRRYIPPLHWNCRSSIVPVLLDKKALLAAQSDRIKKKALEDLPAGKLSGDAVDKEDYTGWLKRQPMDIKVSHLGSEEKVALFEKGHLAIKEFFTPKGKGLSIGALRRLDNARTSIFPTRQAAISVTEDAAQVVNVTKPRELITSIDAQNQLRAMFISDADSMNQAISLTDFRGTSLAGKRVTRVRANNEFDERNVSFDPFTGEMKSTLLYDPDFAVYQERLDFLNASKLLNPDQKEFIKSFADSLEDKVSVNQQSVVVENLRVLFERYTKDKKPWDSFMLASRAESQYSTVNVSRILDRRSRERSELFASYLGGEDPKVQIFGEYIPFSDLAKNYQSNVRYANEWALGRGQTLATKAYLTGDAPLQSYFFSPELLIADNYKLKTYTKKLMKHLDSEVKPYKGFYDRWIDKPEETISNMIADAKGKTRSILELEFVHTAKKDALYNLRPDSHIKATRVLAKLMSSVADGTSTDYDALAINLGKQLRKEWVPLFPFHSATLDDFHADGSKLLEGLRDQKLIRVISRGKVRRSAIDIDTGRPSGAWQETVSREVQIIDPEMLKLQAINRQIVIAERIGVTTDSDRFIVRPGQKTYFDARGHDTKKSVITRRASGNYDKVLIDKDFADMLNHTMSVEYEIDRGFSSFMDDLVRFRDPRGKVKKYDDLNDFRKLILQRGEQGFGLMQTIKWHMQRNKPFRTIAQIDGRGRVYYEGYLTPTGGEVVRPFLNSAVPRQFGQIELRELMTQIGSMIGPATEALTQSGRATIFMRNEKDILSLGSLMLSPTQRDRRIREFLEHPIIRAHDAEEIPKIARLALEYARIREHVGGDFNNLAKLSTYRTKLMIENDASSSGAQIIGLSTGDRSISINSNVLATDKKNRLYDLVAMDTASDPEFHSIKALSGANITWEDLAKAAKAQNMVSFYGAGKATQAANIEAKFASVLEKKGYTVVTRDELRPILKQIDKSIKDAEYLGADNVVIGLKGIKKELVEVVEGEIEIGADLIKAAGDIHPDVAVFVDKLTNVRVGLIGPKEFKQVSEIMSRHLADRAPVTGKFVQFWKAAANAFINETEKVDIPWVTFDGKVLYQRYRPKVQTAINFIDPVTGRRVKNIYQDSVTDGNLIGKSSTIRASIGLGVNGNHMNDASIVRQFHLWGKKNNVPTATIHDAFFTNIGDATKAKLALREIYADALDGDTIRNTLKQMRKEGMSEETYQRLVKQATEDGLIDPPNKIKRSDILAPIPKGMDWYGIGP